MSEELDFYALECVLAYEEWSHLETFSLWQKEKARADRLERINTTLLAACKNQTVWIARLLEGPRLSRGYSDPSGHPHGYAVVEIPDWDLRQKLESLREGIALAETPAESAGAEEKL